MMTQQLPESTLVPAPVIAWGEFLFKWRNTVFPLVMAALLLGFHPAGAGRTWDLWLDLAALTVILMGSALRILVVGLAYIKRGGLNKKVYADNLVTDGMFAHGRNPLYVGNLMVLIGILLMHGSPWVIALGSAFYLASYGAIVAAEERFLAGKFGDAYRDYCARVPRWSIRLKGMRETFRGFSFNWRRVVVKEYSSICTGAVMVLLVLGEEALVGRGLEAARPALWTVAAAMVGVGLLALFVRALKKTGRLSERAA
jgi:protein-S-isoprenylcysteine O-methyltransferase Ste14